MLRPAPRRSRSTRSWSRAVAATVAVAGLLVTGCEGPAGPGLAGALAPPPSPSSPTAAARGDYCRREAQVTRIAGLDHAPAPAQAAPPVAIAALTWPRRPVHTYSIVARDPVTGELGAAVQSHWFGVGSLVVWAEPGVGAVATQSFVELGYGPRGLAAMRDGAAPADALAALVAADPQQAVRQVGMVDAAGRAAAHTGDRCIAHAGHHVGAGFAVQANMMGTDQVVAAMARAFEGARGDLAERMLVALEAAQAVGGDVRGCQSAALVVVSGARTATPWSERRFDLRVEDAAAPLAELRRLLGLARAYRRMDDGDRAAATGDLAGALSHYDAARQLAGGNPELEYWAAVTLAGQGQVDQAIPMFRRVFASDPRWVELTRRLLRPGLIPDTPAGRAALDRIVREAAPAAP